MTEVEKAIQEFEDNLYHESLHPEISVESKVIALKILKEKEMHGWLIDKFEKLKHDYAELKISEQSLRNAANGFKEENAELQSQLSKAAELLEFAKRDIEDELVGRNSHSCQMCKYYKNCRRNAMECEKEAEWQHITAMRELGIEV